MRILVTGATGLIGTRVCRELARRKHELAIVSRDPKRAETRLELPVRGFRWDALGEGPFPSAALEGVDAIVHLAGEPIADRIWTRVVRERIVRSRVQGSTALSAALSSRPSGERPKAFVAASAIGFYGNHPEDDWVTENSARGSGFLADTCGLWEEASLHTGSFCGRTVITRIGLVLSCDGGILQRMIPPFKAGLGVVFGSGLNWMSWIHIQDLVALLCDAVERPAYSGTFNAVAPNPVRQGEFARELNAALGRKRLFKLPAPLLKLALRDMSELALGGQRVKPERAQTAGFKFEQESLAGALKALIL